MNMFAIKEFVNMNALAQLTAEYATCLRFFQSLLIIHAFYLATLLNSVEVNKII